MRKSVHTETNKKIPLSYFLFFNFSYFLVGIVPDLGCISLFMALVFTCCANKLFLIFFFYLFVLKRNPRPLLYILQDTFVVVPLQSTPLKWD